MTAYCTGNEKMPYIFVNHNGASFVQTVRRKGSRHNVAQMVTRVRHIQRYEALRFAEVYNLPDIKKHLALPGAATGTTQARF